MKKNLPVIYVAGCTLITASEFANAAVPVAVETAINTAATDGAAAAALVLLVFLGIKAVRWLRSAL